MSDHYICFTANFMLEVGFFFFLPIPVVNPQIQSSHEGICIILSHSNGRQNCYNILINNNIIHSESVKFIQNVTFPSLLRRKATCRSALWACLAPISFLSTTIPVTISTAELLLLQFSLRPSNCNIIWINIYMNTAWSYHQGTRGI